MVFVGSNDNNVYGLDAATGEERWRYETGDSVTSSPAVAEGVVFIGSFDGYVYGLDSATGGERWRYQAGPILSSPSVVGNVVYFGSADGRLLARQPFNPMNIGG
jgi:outer membrane protein assembly factor BamB